MTAIGYHRVFICLEDTIFHFTIPSVFRIMIFLDNYFAIIIKNECILLAYMQHSRPQINLYHADILLSWGGRILHIVESLTMILLSEFIASLIPPSSDGLTIML